MYQQFSDFIKDKKQISIIQAENPDGDSLGSALALSQALPNRIASLYCPVDLPKYLRYYHNWSNVNSEFDFQADAFIIVDTAANLLLSKLLDDPAIRHQLETKPVLVLDHHETADDLSFEHQSIIENLPSCCSLIYKIFKDQNITIDQTTAEYLFQGLLSDTLGLSTESVDADSFLIAADLSQLGAKISNLEERRREFMKKSRLFSNTIVPLCLWWIGFMTNSRRILDYKADLIKRIEYHLDGKLATIHIPWEDIANYSDEYNPNVLILEEMRMVEGVELAVAIKTYPDGKLTGKIRSSEPIAERVAGYFGGGGHPHAAGFRTYDTDYNSVVKELVNLLVKQYDA